MAGTFHCSVITPERAMLETEATFVAFPAHDGEVGILRDRAPLLYRMGIGELRVESPEGNHVFFVAGGFAQMVDNRLTLLTEQAKPVEEIDVIAERKTILEIQEKGEFIPDDAAFQARQQALKRAQVQAHLAEKHETKQDFKS